MATTRIIPLHEIKWQSISETLLDRTDYAENAEKTNEGEYVSAYGCLPQHADVDFMLARKNYEYHKGQIRGNIIAYHIRQSFKPGEITPELANQIGHELVMNFTKGKYQFVVGTHTDKAHIHNHIVFNAISMDGSKKFRDPLRSARIIRRISDELCAQYGLSIVENPKQKSVTYDKWLGDKKTVTFKGKLAADIDAVISKCPKDFQEFLSEMEAAGYEIAPLFPA